MVHFTIAESMVIPTMFKVEGELNMKILCLRTDSGRKYLSNEFTIYLQEHKIRRQLTCPNTPKQNGVAERKNRHLAET